MQDSIKNGHISYKFTYIMVSLFGGLIATSFIAFSFYDKATDVPLEWLVGYVSLLAWYVGKKQWTRDGNHKPSRFPGEIFVGLCWIIYFILPFLHQMGLVDRKSILLTPYFISVTSIYAGGNFAKLYKNGFRFFTKNITSP